MNSDLLRIYLAGLASLARIEGMKAENMQRAAIGNSMAYSEEPFFNEATFLDRLAIEAANSSPELR